jgi:hypothetical protein
MKSRTLIQAAVIAALAVAPALSFAQAADVSQAPKTRAEVRAELIQLEQAGYNPALSNDAEYPADIQAAEARIHQQGAADTSYGPATGGTTQSGPAAPQTAPANSSY